MKYGVCLFRTTSAAMQAQKILNSKGYGVTLIPTPRGVSGGCGITIRFNWMEEPMVKEALEKGGVEIQAVQEIT